MARQPFLTDSQRNQLLANLAADPQFRQLRPTERALRIQEIVRGILPRGADPIADTQHLYISFQVNVHGMSDRSARNSWVAASGVAFQRFVKEYINDALRQRGILALEAPEFTQIATTDLVQFLTLPARRRCVQAGIELWPDSDVILVTRNQAGVYRVFGIISCKTSFHARETESCFWALATRDLGIRYALVTADLDDELGTCSNPSKPRRLLEAYFDKAYSTNPNTSFCSQVRPHQDSQSMILCDDVVRWRQELVPDTIDMPISLI